LPANSKAVDLHCETAETVRTYLADQETALEDNSDFSPRLDMIETEWTMFRDAHQQTGQTGAAARNSLVLRYATAIRGYVRAITRSETDADELSQDVIVRLLSGDFGGADPDRGRFRDLLKVAVKNMTRNHWDKQNRRKGVDYDLNLEGDESANQIDLQWTESWRRNILDIAWARLESFQDSKEGSVLYTALRLRSDHPDADSTKLAELISSEHVRDIPAATYRQNLRRARVRFAEYVVEEVANGMETPNQARIQEELIAVGLYEHIKDVLPESWNTNEM